MLERSRQKDKMIHSIGEWDNDYYFVEYLGDMFGKEYVTLSELEPIKGSTLYEQIVTEEGNPKKGDLCFEVDTNCKGDSTYWTSVVGSPTQYSGDKFPREVGNIRKLDTPVNYNEYLSEQGLLEETATFQRSAPKLGIETAEELQQWYANNTVAQLFEILDQHDARYLLQGYSPEMCAVK